MNIFEKYIINKTKDEYWDMLQFLMYFCNIDSVDDIAKAPHLTIRQLVIFKLIIQKCLYLEREITQ